MLVSHDPEYITPSCPFIVMFSASTDEPTTSCGLGLLKTFNCKEASILDDQFWEIANSPLPVGPTRNDRRHRLRPQSLPLLNTASWGGSPQRSGRCGLGRSDET
jgi:hypothetical protein